MLLLSLSPALSGQQRVIDVEQIFVQALQLGERDTLFISNYLIVDKQHNSSWGAVRDCVFCPEKLSSFQDIDYPKAEFDSIGRLIIKPAIHISRSKVAANILFYFKDVVFTNNVSMRFDGSLKFENSSAQRGLFITSANSEIENTRGATVEVSDCSLSGFDFKAFSSSVHYRYFKILNSQINDIYISSNASIGDFTMKGSHITYVKDDLFYAEQPKADTLAKIQVKAARKRGLYQFPNLDYKHHISLSGVDNVVLDSNIIDHSLNGGFYIGAEAENFTMHRNVFNTNLVFFPSKIEKEFVFVRNEVNEYLCFSNVQLSEFNYLNKILWDQLAGFKLIIRPVFDEDFYFHIQNDNAFTDEVVFEDLIVKYQTLYKIYRDRGDLYSANACYVELKDIYTQKFRHDYKTQGKLDKWFRWRLSQLLKFYTEHCTDPARALVMSFYIILIFSGFYFFFPSDWDKSSKKYIYTALFEGGRFKIKNVLLSLSLLFMALINAFTLSLNAFTTLGFGNIPTTGISRYVAILQGFLGWFLLGLFSVSLINQVLA